MIANTAAARDVLAERARQVEAEGWTPEHDDAHAQGEMAVAAAHYAMAVGVATWLGTKSWKGSPIRRMVKPWPWDATWWKPGCLRRMLVKAAALLLAEIERIDRAADATAATPAAEG